MKRIFILLFTLISLMANAGSVKIDGIVYDLDNNNHTAEVSRSDYSGKIIIPPTITYNDIIYDVVSIGPIAFGYNSKDLISVEIPNSVTSIGEKAFTGCENLISITIPDNVKTIGDEAFAGCTGLIQVSLPNQLEYLGRYAFSYCKSLHSIILPNSLKEISGHTFENCSNLTSITIPNSIQTIKENSFTGCENLISIDIPEGVEYISWGLFEGCRNLRNITIPSTISIIYSYAFSGCSELTELTLPEGIKSIHYGAFLGCSKLNSIIIPPMVTTIEESTFENCYTLNHVFLPDNITEIGKRAFKRCYRLSSIVIPESVSTIGENAFEECNSIVSIELPKELTILKSKAFFNCYRLESVMISQNVEYIYQEAFSGCNNLEQVIVHAQDPPYAFDNSFSKYNINLFVPKESFQNYKETNPWNNFSTIIALDSKFKLIYKIDGSNYKTYELDYGAVITPEVEPKKEGYSFSGWSEIPKTMPAHDVIITGTFIVNKYKLTYIVDGSNYKTYEIDYGAVITPEVEPNKEGYSFSGWSVIPKTMPAHDVSVTGSFTVNKYILTYMINGDVYKTFQVDYGTTITPEAAPTKTGYTFSGWDDVPVTMPAKDVTISGTFVINSYLLTYLVDGDVYKTIEVVYDSAISPEPEPTKDGYTFSGWSEIPETMPAHDVTISGAFIVNKYKVTYILDGEVFFIDYVEFGTTIVPPTVNEKEGFTFSGWVDVPGTMPAHDITIYGNLTSGLAGIVMAAQGDVRIFSPNGKKMDSLQKGLNIVVLADGKVKKVTVK